MIDLESTWRLFLQSLADVKMFCLTYYLIQWYLHLNDLNLNQIKQKYVQIHRLIFQWNKSSYFVTSYFSFHNLYAFGKYLWSLLVKLSLKSRDVFHCPFIPALILTEQYIIYYSDVRIQFGLLLIAVILHAFCLMIRSMYILYILKVDRLVKCRVV